MSGATDNLALWRSLEKTNTKFVKPITGKAYSGTSPSPHWIRMRLTEQLGPHGIGWGVNVISEDIQPVGTDGTKLHSVHIRLWYKLGGERGEVEAFGGTPMCYPTKAGRFMSDEDYRKKSLTDAFVKAAAEIGVCADIFLGRWDDSKYVAQLRQEEIAAERAAAQSEAKAAGDDSGQKHGAWAEMEWPVPNKAGGWEDLRDRDGWIERHLQWVERIQRNTDINGGNAAKIEQLRRLWAKFQGVMEMLKDRGFESTVEEVETVYASAVKQLEGGE